MKVKDNAQNKRLFQEAENIRSKLISALHAKARNKEQSIAIQSESRKKLAQG